MSTAVLTPPTTISRVPQQTEPVRWKWTRDDLVRLYELGMFQGQRVMLIDGEVLAMSPMNEPHARGTVYAMEALQRTFGPSVTVRVQMPMDFGQNTDPEPDVAVIQGTSRSQPPGPPSAALLVVEVSDTSLSFDMGDKASLYAAAGIADYWVLDIVGRRLGVFRDPRPDPAQRFGHRYLQSKVYWSPDRVSPLAAPAGSILVADLLP
jgi:Uma2 family endonuclease